jgi:cell division protein FtsQ
MVVAFLATGVWVIKSPALSVKAIDVEGAINTPVDSILAEAGITSGEPLLLVTTGSAEVALRANPFVADVAVRKVFPNTIEVVLIERVPVAVLEHRTGGVVVAADGMVLAAVGEVGVATGGRVLASADPVDVGERITEVLDLAAIRFLAAWQGMPAVVSQIDGELWAEVDGFTVRLGGPIEMDQKARSLAAVILEGQPAGSLINVIAPTRPTVMVPQADAGNPPPTP